ncbi:DUF6920 family protein [Chloroflexota bacterium]
MVKKLTLSELWALSPNSTDYFSENQLTEVPEEVQRYIKHAISPDTLIASAAWLKMHGEIKLKSWLPFVAEQVISWKRGMIWSAKVKMYGMQIKGSDRIIEGEGMMNWNLFGFIPIVKAHGDDITRSAVGRMSIESIWLPSVYTADSVSWGVSKKLCLDADLPVNGSNESLHFCINDTGGLKSVRMFRWGNPGGSEFGYHEFGAIVEEEATFGGYTIPSRLRAGWYFDTDKFENDGEFIGIVIDDASYK